MQLQLDNERLIIMRGVSGSGKTTWARAYAAHHPHTTVVSRDDIRKSIVGDDKIEQYFAHSMDESVEQVVTQKECWCIARGLCAGETVIVDNTNLKVAYAAQYTRIALDCGVSEGEISLQCCETPSLDEACRRVQQRGYMIVPRAYIHRQIDRIAGAQWTIVDAIAAAKKLPHQSWRFPSFHVDDYQPCYGQPNAILFDIDGTLAHRDVLSRPRVRYRGYYEYGLCSTDLVDAFVGNILRGVIKNDVMPIFITGRKKDCETETRQFIENIIGGSKLYKLYMRDPVVDFHLGQNDSDDKVKYRLFNTYVRDNWNVLGVFEDRRRVVAMWEALGLRVANMGLLNEEF